MAKTIGKNLQNWKNAFWSLMWHYFGYPVSQGR